MVYGKGKLYIMLYVISPETLCGSATENLFTRAEEKIYELIHKNYLWNLRAIKISTFCFITAIKRDLMILKTPFNNISSPNEII